MEAAGKDGLASLHIPAAFCCIAQIFDLHLEHFQAETERERDRGGREESKVNCRYYLENV